MIDFHNHLDLYPNALSLLEKVARNNHFILAVTISPKAWVATSKVFYGYSNIKVALGLHPEIADIKYSELDLMISLIKDSEFIGEIGLDGSSRYKNSFKKQNEIIRLVLSECENVGGRVISLHSRSAADQVMDVLESYPNAGIPILHWFSGTIGQLTRAINLGLWFSVGPSMLQSQKGKVILSKIPINKILPETDGPFATRKTGEPWTPGEIDDVIMSLANIHHLTPDEVRSQIIINTNEVLFKSGFKISI